jgi:manganese-dependent ADP-ribose/CDP-alcohol diphosphatase
MHSINEEALLYLPLTHVVVVAAVIAQHKAAAVATAGAITVRESKTTSVPYWIVPCLPWVYFQTFNMPPYPTVIPILGRFYRHALSTARHAAQHFQDCRVNVVVQLGDIIDGKCQSEQKGHEAVDDVLEALSVYTHGSIVHIYGNHCLYNMDRRTLAHKLGMPIFAEAGNEDGELVGYYSQLVPGTNVRLVVLDSYDVTMLQRSPESSLKRARAVEILQHYNAKNYQAGLENSADGLVGLEKRFVAYNGQVGQVQLQWLHHQLALCREADERVVILSHQPILPESCNPNCLMWNYHDVLDVLRRYPDVVMASLAGHAHKGGYGRDAVSGIHFRVVEAVLETPPPHHSYALVDVYTNRIHVRGFGDCKSAVYWCNHQSTPNPKTSAPPQLSLG